MRMDLEVVDALKAAGVPDDKARAVVASLHREIDQRYALHAAQLATRGDLLDAFGAGKVEMARLHADSMATVGAVKLEMARLHADSMATVGAVKLEMARLHGDSMEAVGAV